MVVVIVVVIGSETTKEKNTKLQKTVHKSATPRTTTENMLICTIMLIR